MIAIVAQLVNVAGVVIVGVDGGVLFTVTEEASVVVVTVAPVLPAISE